MYADFSSIAVTITSTNEFMRAVIWVARLWFLIKKFTDDVRYKFSDGKNHLTIVVNLK